MLGLRPPGLEVWRAVSSHLSAYMYTKLISFHIEHFVINPSIPTTNMGVSIQITRTDANLVLINVKTILPTLSRVNLYPKVIGLRVPSGI